MAYVGNPHYMVHIFSTKPSNPNNIVNVKAPMPEAFTFDTASQYDAPFTQGLTGNAIIDTLMKIGTGARLINQNMTAQIWQGSAETELGLQLEFHAEADPHLEVRAPIISLMELTTPDTLGADGFLVSPGPKIDSAVVNELKSNAQSLTSSLLQMVGLDDVFNIGSTSNDQPKQGHLVDPAMICTNGNSQPINTTSPSTSNVYGQTNSFRKYVKDQISIRLGNFAFFDSVVITNVQKTYESKFDARTGLPMHARVDIRFKPLFMIVRQDLQNIFFPPPASGIASGARSMVGNAIDNVAQAFPITMPNKTNLPIPF